MAAPIYDQPVVNQTIIIGQSPNSKNPGLAAVLSFFYPGLGQFYNGHFLKGIFFLFIWPILFVVAWLIGAGVAIGATGVVAEGGSDQHHTAAAAMGSIFLVILIIAAIAGWIWPIVDAYRSADRINRRSFRSMMRRSGGRVPYM